MRNKATTPVIVVAVVAVIALVALLGKYFLASSPTNTGKHTFPSFIDPSTGKPWAGRSGGSGENAPAGAGGGSMQMQGGRPGGQ